MLKRRTGNTHISHKPSFSLVSIRAHRIGQTRDVHIYRFVARNTIEENILRKANQKRILGSVAIEEGRFNIDGLKENQLRNLIEARSLFLYFPV